MKPRPWLCSNFVKTVVIFAVLSQVALLCLYWPSKLVSFSSRSAQLATSGLESETIAWVTSAYGNDEGYNNLVLALIKSLRAHGATEPIFVLDDGHLDPALSKEVPEVGGTILKVDPVEVPDKVALSLDEIRHLPNFVRLRMWNLTQFDRIIYVDGDMLAVGDVEALRRLPCPAAAPQKKGTVNGGLIVLCPNESLAAAMAEKLRRADRSYPVAEQTFISYYFWGKWHFVSTCLNARAYDYSERRHAILHWHLFFWPWRDTCQLEDIVLVHFSTDHKPWHPDAEEFFPLDLLNLYEAGMRTYLPNKPLRFKVGPLE